MYNLFATTFSGGKAGHLIQPVALSKIRFNLKEIVMSRFKNIAGQKFGLLEAIIEVPSKKGSNAKWYCLCDCGGHKVVIGSSLRIGKTKSCGCLVSARTTLRNIKYTHGDYGSRLHTIWRNMKRRCYYAKDTSYPRYGGRGISVCSLWREDFIAFKKWALVNGYSDNLTIDRMDNNGNYSPNNCKWSSPKEQANNRSSNKQLTFRGKTKTLMEWSEYLDIPYCRIKTRLNRAGWSVEKALTHV